MANNVPHVAPSPHAASRGFVSAHCLGSQGKRAVWVERRRGSTVREVLVWGKDAEDSEEVTGHMDGSIIYAVGSYDLRGDWHSRFANLSLF